MATVGKTFPDFTALWCFDGPGGVRHLRNRSGYLDEDDVRVRAGRGSQPRTRRRPAHEGAPEAFVVNVDRGRYGCLIDDGDGDTGTPGGGRMVTAMKARELGRNSVVVGDRVALAGDTSGEPGVLARIVRVEERTSVLRRSPDDTDPLERIVVANADQMVIVCALADPAPRTRFVDRCLVAAYDAGLDPLLVLTKSDLASPRQVRAFYRPLGMPMISTRQPLPPQTHDPAAPGARRPAQRADRPVGSRQVHAGQRAGAGGGPGRRRGQPGDRAWPAHVVFRDRAAPAAREVPGQ